MAISAKYYVARYHVKWLSRDYKAIQLIVLCENYNGRTSYKQYLLAKLPCSSIRRHLQLKFHNKVYTYYVYGYGLTDDRLDDVIQFTLVITMLCI